MTEFKELQAWAAALVVDDLDRIRRQITEYGSVDLEMMGIGLLEAAQWDEALIGDETGIGMELALIFYLQGKVARCVSAVAAKKRPSDDTLRDLRVYALMLGHVREFGHWKIEGAAPDADRRGVLSLPGLDHPQQSNREAHGPKG